MPALVVLLARAEKQKGAPLVENDVLALRDGATVVMVPANQTEAITRERGYDDLDPENCWVEWQRVRLDLQGSSGGK
jgi:hypothetical protein